MKKVLIFGISGFTGLNFRKYIKNHCLNVKYIFYMVDKDEFEEKLENFKFIQLNIYDKEKVKKIILNIKPDFIINLIGTYSTQDLEILSLVNSEFPRFLIQTIIDENLQLEKILLIGSAAEYGVPKTLPLFEDDPLEPLNGYGVSKVVQTTYFQYYNRTSTIKANLARTFNISGKLIPKNLALGRFKSEIEELKNGEILEVGNINTKRDYIDIEDVIDAYWKILIHGEIGEIYNVCSGISYKMKMLIDQMIKVSNKKLDVRVNEKYIKENDVLDIYGDNSKLRKLGWAPKIKILDSITLMMK